MNGLSESIIVLLRELVPGFIVAWIFYGLTSYLRQSQFAQIVHALIFSTIIQAFVKMTEWCLNWIGESCPKLLIGVWTEDAAFIYSLLFGVAFGLVLSYFANNDSFHDLLRKMNLTKRTAFAHEWYSAFKDGNQYVVLHLTGERRLYGWPSEWPDNPDRGHFIMMRPEWLLEKKNGQNKRIPLDVVDKILIPATEVEMVEFVKSESEISDSTNGHEE